MLREMHGCLHGKKMHGCIKNSHKYVGKKTMMELSKTIKERSNKEGKITEQGNFL